MTPARRPGGRERIVLVGFMGAGKTTVGRLLAEILAWDFADLDAEIEHRAGKTVAAIFREDGEPAFRDAEQAAALHLANGRRLVIAAGGGAFELPGTRQALATGAVTVWLRCALPALLARIADDGSRPRAANRETITALLQKREPTYALADLVVDTTSVAPQDAARAVADAAMRLEPGTIPR